MRILLTNHALAERSGTEIYLRDVALALLARGHEPVAYSPRLGEVAAELRRQTVPVVDDLRQLGEAPDLIHAQHHLEAMTALAHFPSTPAIYACHGWLPAEEAPPRHPQIRRYLAVDALVKRRLCDECGIPSEHVRIHLNFVDFRRFRPRPPLPAKPRRALVFSNYVSDENCLDAIRRACVRSGLDLDVVGRAQGRTAAAPEDLLGRYDVVFAKGRSALEAAAVGTAVVLCDAVGLGPMVTVAEFERLRALNFGVRLLRQEVTEQNLLREIGRYDAADAGQVQQLMAGGAGLDGSVDRLVELYEEALFDAERWTPEPEQCSRAVAAYLRHGPLRGGDLHGDFERRLRADAEHHKGRAAELRQTAEHSRLRAEQLNTQVLALQQELAAARMSAEEAARAFQAELRTERLRSSELHSTQHGEVMRSLGLLHDAAGDAAIQGHEQERRQTASEEVRRAELLEWRRLIEGAAANREASAEIQRQLHEALEAERAGVRRAEEALRDEQQAHALTSAELDRVQASLTWRLSQAILGLPLAKGFYRWLRRLR